MDDFKDSKSALVADVDCTTEGKDLCEKHGVTGYPTIKHGDPNDLKAYQGGRSYDDLKKFADENLGPICGPDNIDLCKDEDKALIEKFQKMDDAELNKAIEEVDAKIKTMEDKSKKAIEKLEKQVEAAQAKTEAEKKKSEEALAKEKKKIGLGMMKAVAAATKKKEEKGSKEEKGGKKKRKGKKEL